MREGTRTVTAQSQWAVTAGGVPDQFREHHLHNELAVVLKRADTLYQGLV